MPTNAKKIEDNIDTVIAILTKTNAMAAVATVAAAGIIELFRKKGLAVPTFTPAELNQEMRIAAGDVVANAQRLKAQIREEFGLPNPDAPEG